MILISKNSIDGNSSGGGSRKQLQYDEIKVVEVVVKEVAL